MLVNYERNIQNAKIYRHKNVIKNVVLLKGEDNGAKWFQLKIIR